MTWFKIDDSFYDHPKVFDAPDCAVALWTRAGTWSARSLTDGFVPAGMPARLCDDPDTAVRELVRRGLWSRASGGYRFHDWGNYQPSKESVEDLRSKRANAGRRGGQAKAVRQMASNGLASASEVAKQNAAPTRPDPTKDNNDTSSSPAAPATESETPASRSKVARTSTVGTDNDPEFVRFWGTYPRKEGKGQARKAWAKAIKARADPEAIITGAARYAAERAGKERQYTAHPATWLHGERWDDTPYAAERIANGTAAAWWEN